MLAPLVAELEHRTLDFSADLKTLGVGCFGCEDSFLDCTVNEGCTLLGADLDKGCLSGTGSDDTPVPAGKVCLAGDLHLAAAAVRPAAVAGLFEFVDGDTLVASLVLDDELALVDLFLVHLLGVDTVLVGDHLAGQ